jgi:hypothetical protein
MSTLNLSPFIQIVCIELLCISQFVKGWGYSIEYRRQQISFHVELTLKEVKQILIIKEKTSKRGKVKK